MIAGLGTKLRTSPHTQHLGLTLCTSAPLQSLCLLHTHISQELSLLDLWAQQLGEIIFCFVGLPVDEYSLLLSGFLET